MQTITQTVGGAQTLQFNINGKYFTILATTLGLNVRFYRGGKKLDLGDIKALLAGLEVSFDANDAFDRVEIDTLGADTFVIGLSNGQSRYNRSQGNVTVTSGTLTSVATITNPVSVQNTSATPLLSQDNGLSYGASYKSVTNMAANTPDTIFTPAANVNGALIISAHAWGNNAGGSQPALIAKTSAPTSVIDGDVIASPWTGSNSNGNNGYVVNRVIKIAAGKGLYHINGLAEGVANAQRSVLYTLL